MELDLKLLMRRHTLARALGAATDERLRKEDIPEVQFEIQLLASLVERLWALGAERALGELLAQAESLAAVRQEDFQQDVVVAFLLSLFVAFDQESLESSVLLPATRRLLEAGARSIGQLERVTFDPRFLALERSAANDLHFWLRQRLREREEPLRELLEAWAASPPEERTEDLEALLADVADVVGDPKGTVSDYITDLWAYRTFNAGVVAAASAAGIQELILFNNPAGGGPDSSTTSFCRAIHGRVVATQGLLGRFQNYYLSQSRGDVADAKDALPLISSKEAQLQDGTAEEVFSRHALGVPPFHGRCRTVLRLRTAAQQ